MRTGALRSGAFMRGEQIRVGLMVVVPAAEAVIGGLEEFVALNALHVGIAEDHIVAAVVTLLGGLDDTLARSEVGSCLEVMRVDIEQGPTVKAVACDRHPEVRSS